MRISYNPDEIRKLAVNAMQVNRPDQYIRSLSMPMRWGENPNPDGLILAEKFKKDYGELPPDLGEYKLADEYGVTKVYEVTDSNSGKTFATTFYFYGGIISGWNVELKR